MSLLKHILSPFVEFEDEKKKQAATENTPRRQADDPLLFSPEEPAPAPAAPVTQVTTPPPSLTTPVTSQVPPNTTLLPEHQQYFEKLIEDENASNPLFQGTDFKEFIDSKIDVQAIADEATRYTTAFNVLKRTGLTRERLLTTGQQYIEIIGRQMNNFQSAHAQRYQKEVKQKELLLQQKAAEMKALNDKITALNNEIKQLSQEVVVSKDKLNASKNSFLLAGENKQKEIQTELQKIARYF